MHFGSYTYFFAPAHYYTAVDIPKGGYEAETNETHEGEFEAETSEHTTSESEGESEAETSETHEGEFEAVASEHADEFEAKPDVWWRAGVHVGTYFKTPAHYYTTAFEADISEINANYYPNEFDAAPQIHAGVFEVKPSNVLWRTGLHVGTYKYFSAPANYYTTIDNSKVVAMLDDIGAENTPIDEGEFEAETDEIDAEAPPVDEGEFEAVDDSELETTSSGVI